MKQLLAIIGLALATAVFVQPAVAAVPPPAPLTDEGFFDPKPTVTGACNAAGTSTIDFSAAGVASGPYPGTFTETGTASIGPQPAGTAVTLTASFTIDSPVGQVSGSKQFTATSFGTGICRNLSGFTAEFIDTLGLRYTATIRNQDGVFTDRGSSSLQIAHNTNGVVTSPEVSSFVEFFQSDAVTPEPCPQDNDAQDDCDRDDQ
jgi:hypothetical protein